MLKLMEWLAKFAFDRILGAIVGSAALVAIVNGALREWTALPGYWRWSVVLSAFAVCYNLLLWYGPRWRVVATTADPETIDLNVLADYDRGICRLIVTNDGKTDTFAVEVTYISGVSTEVWPSPLRWRGTQQETREIVKGHTQILEVLKVEHVKAPERRPEGRFTVGPVMLLTPFAEVPLSIRWHATEKIASLEVVLKITSSQSGARRDYVLHVFIATDGHATPFCEAVLGAN